MKQQMEIPRVQVQYKSKEKDSKHNRARVIPMQRHALLILLDMRSNSLFIDAECMNCMCVTIFNYQLTFIKLRLRVTKDLILISEDIVVNIKLIGHRTLDNNKTKRAVYIYRANHDQHADYQIGQSRWNKGHSVHTSTQDKFVLSIVG